MSEGNLYTPYLEAVKQILNGTPVKNLEEIRDQCNKAFLMEKPSRIIEGYTAEVIVVSFAANAENRILMGEDPKKVYGPTTFSSRKKSRKFLQDAVQDYL